MKGNRRTVTVIIAVVVLVLSFAVGYWRGAHYLPKTQPPNAAADYWRQRYEQVEKECNDRLNRYTSTYSHRWLTAESDRDHWKKLYLATQEKR